MSAFALALILVAALIHAGWNVLAKKASGGAPFVWLYGAAATVLYAPIAAWLLVRDAHTLSLGAWGLVTASGALHLLYALALQRGYQAADLTVVYPRRGSWEPGSSPWAWWRWPWGEQGPATARPCRASTL